MYAVKSLLTKKERAQKRNVNKTLTHKHKYYIHARESQHNNSAFVLYLIHKEKKYA